jgi:hypothetical protein
LTYEKVRIVPNLKKKDSAASPLLYSLSECIVFGSTNIFWQFQTYVFVHFIVLEMHKGGKIDNKRVYKEMANQQA